MAALTIIFFFCLVGVYAPFFASGKPIFVMYDNVAYFPLFRYLFYLGYFTKPIDLFFNLLIFTLPIFFIGFFLHKKNKKIGTGICISALTIQIAGFILIMSGIVKDPAADSELNRIQQKNLKEYISEHHKSPLPDWNESLQYLNDYGKLNILLKYIRNKEQNENLEKFESEFKKGNLEKWLNIAVKEKRAALLREGIKADSLPNEKELRKMVLETTPAHIYTNASSMPTLYKLNEINEENLLRQFNKTLEKYAAEGKTTDKEYLYAAARKKYLIEKNLWIQEEIKKIQFRIMPLLRSFHWEEDAGGEQELNKYISFWELTRINRKDMVSALIFGIRISLVVGIIAVALSLAIGIPIGAFAGFYGGKFDIIVSRLLEIWESMPTIFMLLFIVAITESKSILLIITVIGLFGWTNFSRFVRGEFFKQRNLAYVEACKASGFSDNYIIFTHILPNAIPPLLTLLPFAVMGAITSEAALSFLGLGEEGSCSWGVLMDEGRSAFPGESYLLWPPAFLLTILLIAIAMVGDTLRDVLDPKFLR